MLMTVGIFSLDSQSCDGFFCEPTLFLLGLGVGAFGLTIGPPLAIWGIGKALDDRGRFWATFGGGAIGTLASPAVAPLPPRPWTRACKCSRWWA
jgi:hypothetical protein